MSNTTQAKHTPGPWEANEYNFNGDNKWFVEHRHHPKFPNAKPSIAAMNGPCLLYSNAKNDARLIASAPELLAALRDALNTIKALDEDYDLRDSYKQGELAIQKAEGQEASCE